MAKDGKGAVVIQQASSAEPTQAPPTKPFDWGPRRWWRRLLFSEVDTLVVRGYRTRLEPQDMYTEPTVSTPYLVSTFEPAYAAEKAKGVEKPDLKRIIIRGNIGMLFFTGLLYVISQACSLAGPLLLQRIVRGLNCRTLVGVVPGVQCESKGELYYYCIGLFLAPAIQSLCENHQQYLLYLVGTRMRNSLMAAIYRKCLHLSNSSLQEESTGRVVTLMSNDAQKLQDVMMAIHAMWGSPLYIIAILVLLYQQVKWATFVGLGIMLLLGPMSGKLAAKLGSLRREILQWTDKRVGYMNEVIQGIQMIKFYAWEVPFADKVQSARSQEARILRTTAYWQGIFGLVLFTGPVMVAIFCFGSYTLAGNTLSNADAYTALSLFSLLRFPMSFLPMLITMVVNALVALKRIGNFLARSESSLGEEAHSASHPVGVVRIQNGEFSWDDKTEKSTLRGISFEAKPGTLTMVVGGVGSGKSSIIGALVGHMSKRAGSVAVGGKIAYVAQTAWIMNDTVQENVLMGDEVEASRYRQALQVSQLGPDLDILPNGDLTEIGDRGITLSGGQKQRVSIARAVYSDADVYLLDDPLSAVDSHVGRALFEQCIRGPLKDKTVILVTNALHHLPAADNILWLEGGELKAQGTYTELVAKGLDIEELAHMNDSDQEEEEAKGEAAGDEAMSGPPSGKGGERVSLSKPNARRSVDKRASLDKKGVVGKGKVTLTRQETSANRNLTGVEEREAGNLSLDVVTRYFDGGGGWLYVALIVMMFAAEQGARVYTDRWVGVWFSDSYNRSTAFYLGIYFALGVLYGALTFARSLRFLYCCVNAAVSLHNQLLTHILRLPKTFFDTNPAGRILNRFSRDTDIMDNTLSVDLIQFAGCIATLTSSLIVIAIATKWFAIALVPLAIIYLLLQRLYIPSARELQRIESVSRSPIYNRFAEAMLGVATIRAYRKGEHFTAMSDQLMHANANAFMTQKLAATWLALRLDVMGLVILTGCGALVIQGSVSPSIAGLALVYALELTRFLKQATTMGSKTETDFNSVERIVQYLAPEPEPAPDSPPDVMAKLGEAWPSAGAITVKELTMRYRPEMPLVLRGVSFQVAAGQKVGLVGRTGSGKSSMLLALFRMVEKEAGSIIIDGVDVSSLGVRHLRSKMSIIPQDPFMFSGSVRVNLDPFELHTDAQLWEVVNAVGLTAAITELEDKLGAKVVDNGANFSLGQRQLFCMARAMLRNSKILMLDEATASVDLDTDNMIQTAVRSAFQSCTMLTIAHRLLTIMDSDKVLVMDSGRVVEDAHPADLLDNEKGIFTGMVNQTGKSSARYLRSVAQAARRGDTSFRAFANQRTGLNFAASASRMAATAAATDAIVAAEDMHVTLDGLGDKEAQLALGHGTQSEVVVDQLSASSEPGSSSSSSSVKDAK